MKNYYSTQLIVLSSIALITGNAFAQTLPDVTEINRQAAQQAAHLPAKESKLLQYLVNGLNPSLKARIAKDRSLTENDQAKIDLLTCADDILNENRGGAQAPQVAFESILKGMDENGWLNDSLAIASAAKICVQTKAGLNRYSDNKIDAQARAANRDALPVRNAAENKVKGLIQKLEQPVAMVCEISVLKANAGALIVLGLGWSKVRCELTNEKIVVFTGPNLEFSFGVGADLSNHRYAVKDPKISANSGLHVFSNSPGSSQSDGSFQATVVTGVGSIDTDQYGVIDREKETGFAVGASVRNHLGDGQLGIRFFNGSRHWGKLIDLLN